MANPIAVLMIVQYLGLTTLGGILMTRRSRRATTGPLPAAGWAS